MNRRPSLALLLRTQLPVLRIASEQLVRVRVQPGVLGSWVSRRLQQHGRHLQSVFLLHSLGPRMMKGTLQCRRWCPSVRHSLVTCPAPRTVPNHQVGRRRRRAEEVLWADVPAGRCSCSVRVACTSTYPDRESGEGGRERTTGQQRLGGWCARARGAPEKACAASPGGFACAEKCDSRMPRPPTALSSSDHAIRHARSAPTDVVCFSSSSLPCPIGLLVCGAVKRIPQPCTSMYEHSSAEIGREGKWSQSQRTRCRSTWCRSRMACSISPSPLSRSRQSALSRHWGRSQGAMSDDAIRMCNAKSD